MVRKTSLPCWKQSGELDEGRHSFIASWTSPTDDTSLHKQTPCNRLVPQGQHYLPLLTHSPTDRPSAGHLQPETEISAQNITDEKNCTVHFWLRTFLFLGAAAEKEEEGQIKHQQNAHFFVPLFSTYMFRPIWAIFRLPQSQNILVLKCPIYKHVLLQKSVHFAGVLSDILTMHGSELVKKKATSFTIRADRLTIIKQTLYQS